MPLMGTLETGFEMPWEGLLTGILNGCLLARSEKLNVGEDGVKEGMCGRSQVTPVTGPGVSSGLGKCDRRGVIITEGAWNGNGLR